MGEIKFDEFVDEAVVPNSIESLLGVKKQHGRVPPPVQIFGDMLGDAKELVFGTVPFTETELKVGDDFV